MWKGIAGAWLHAIIGIGSKGAGPGMMGRMPWWTWIWPFLAWCGKDGGDQHDGLPDDSDGAEHFGHRNANQPSGTPRWSRIASASLLALWCSP
jgi:hypothetical protein